MEQPHSFASDAAVPAMPSKIVEPHQRWKDQAHRGKADGASHVVEDRDCRRKNECQRTKDYIQSDPACPVLPGILLKMRRSAKYTNESILCRGMVEDARAHHQAGQCDAVRNLDESVEHNCNGLWIWPTFLISGPALPSEGVAIHCPQ